MHFRSAVVAALVLATGPAWGHGDSNGKKPAEKSGPVSTEEHAFGRAGDSRKVTRAYQVGMDDTMHFRVTAAARQERKSDAHGEPSQIKPGDIVVKRGETVRFLVRNRGKVMHEMVLGTMRELREHAELMKKHPGMEHDEPYMLHVAPGKTAEMGWRFTRPGEFYYGCLVPGHFEAGMVGRIKVTEK